MGERLDSESVRRVMTRYFSVMRDAIERHGGVVEKFIGDAVMAVFGIPTVREDDALRAVRAAGEMRAELDGLNQELGRKYGTELAMRIGVNSGEVIAGDHRRGHTFVVGGAVNVAARLEQAAATGEILLGVQTYRLVRSAVSAEPVEPLELEGKAERMPAYRLLEARPLKAGLIRRYESPLVGRERDLSQLVDVFERVAQRGQSSIVTALGPAGVGKSRLASEFTARLDGRATVLRGRCLPYGDGVTFWPLLEMVRQAAGINGTVSGDHAESRIATLFPGDPRAGAVAARIAAAVGMSASRATPEATFWAVRRPLEPPGVH